MCVLGIKDHIIDVSKINNVMGKNSFISANRYLGFISCKNLKGPRTILIEKLPRSN